MKQSEKKKCEKGLIMIQIDGLARAQLEKAVKKGKMPYLKSLIHESSYNVLSHYSGLPSATPGVQGEIFYGKKCAVPSFGFMQKNSCKPTSMLVPETVNQVQKSLSGYNTSILTNGSAYCDIYNEGTQKSAFCSTEIGLFSYLKMVNPILLIFLLLQHIFIFFRITALLIIELALAITDFFRGIVQSENFWKEIQFIPARVGVCALMRELITANVVIDSTRGLPLIHCNFLGYDEQAHRRGPSSAFAHWTLKGIDDSIKRIHKAALRSKARDYSIMVYSDHGQEHTDCYAKQYGISVHTAISNYLKSKGLRVTPQINLTESIQLKRSAYLGKRLFQRFTNGDVFKNICTEPDGLKVVAIGPLGHVYLHEKLSSLKLNQLGSQLVKEVNIPLVMRADRQNKSVRAWNRKGEWILPEDIIHVAGEDHPFLSELSGDIVELVNHRDSGDFVISGWIPDQKPLSFPYENGAHGGLGKNETHGFALLPLNIKVTGSKDFIRPKNLRRAVLDFMNGD
ncbi:endonuclease [Chitinispirillum alkaliphilum]|nr:endonuclease [Chitinispirillum alkaliphilum]